jgi:flavodoxin
MNVTIVYDSVFGNTGTIAKAMAEALAPDHQVRLLPVAEAGGIGTDDIDLLVVGSPTRGFRATPAIDAFAGGLAGGSGRRAAVFDTRLDLEEIHPAPLRWVVQAGGYAAQRIAGDLERHGYSIADSTGFLVTGTEGPLKAGEAERARAWVRALVE